MRNNRKNLKKHITGLGLLSIAAALIIATTNHYANKGQAIAAQQAKPNKPQQVDVITLQPENITIWQNYSGRLEAIDHVEVRPLVSGTVTEILFEEGSFVEKGTPLFVIDPRPYKAILERNKASVVAAESDVKLAKSELTRAKNLVDKGIISKSRFDSTQNAYRVARANAKAAKAELLQAELNYEYAHIKAPISGKVSRAELTIGNIVDAGPNAPVLTSIVSTNELYVEFDVDEQTYLENIRESKGQKMPIELNIAGDSSVKYDGFIHSFDNQLDTTSGTIRARAILKNKDGALVPGMFADVRLGSASAKTSLVLTEKAIGTDQDKRFVYVVNDKNEITYREVILGHALPGKRIINSGLKQGEKILINSLQRVRPGVVVTPVEVANNSSNSPSPKDLASFK